VRRWRDAADIGLLQDRYMPQNGRELVSKGFDILFAHAQSGKLGYIFYCLTINHICVLFSIAGLFNSSFFAPFGGEGGEE
jgi:hypothetical protein